MTRAERDRLALEVFGEVCDLDADERSRALDRMCKGDGLVRDRVLELLCADAGSEAPISDSVFGAGAGVLARELGEEPGLDGGVPERIGRYRIVREVGRGGMGVVYEAEQDHPRRRVALKIVRRGFATRQTLRRFEHEVRVLGRLDHPGIAHIYEASSAKIGDATWPFFAMEYVEGLALDEYVRTKALTPPHTVELLARVCDAVQHAHQRGVIHRDLKPANIMVRMPVDGGDDSDTGLGLVGLPKVLDFGVARSTEDGRDLTTQGDGVSSVLGTLAYMSPEQLDGDPDAVDTRSDVYAIGVVLYRLLAGRPAFDLSGVAIAESARIVRDQEPTRLGVHEPGLRGDLETIVAKAMAKDRDRRYDSAAALGEDLRRFLRDEPIAARPATAMYQVRKFARRNKPIVAGVLGVFASLLVGVLGVAWFAAAEHRANVESQRLAARSGLSAAAAALREGDIEATARHLDSVPPTRRAWLWSHLSARLDQSLARLPLVERSALLDGINRNRGWIGMWFDPEGEHVYVQIRIDDGILLAVYRSDLSACLGRVLIPDATFVAPHGSDRAAAFTHGLPIAIVDPFTGELNEPVDSAMLSATDTFDMARSSVRVLTERARFLERLSIWGEYPGTLIGISTGHGIGVIADHADVFVVEASTGSRTQLGPHPESTSEAVCTPDGRYVITAGLNRSLACFDLQDRGRKVWERVDAHSDAIMAVDCGPDGTMIVSGGQDGVIRFWDTITGELLSERIGHRAAVLSIAFSPDGKRVVSAGVERVRSWDVPPTPDPNLVWRHSWFVSNMSLSSDGSTLAAASVDAIVLFDAATGVKILHVNFPSDPSFNNRVSTESDSIQITRIAFDPERDRLLWSDQFDRAQAIDLDTGERALIETSLSAYVGSYGQPQGRSGPALDALLGAPFMNEPVASVDEESGRIAILSDNKVRVFDRGTGSRLASFDCPDAFSLSLLPGGDRLAVGMGGSGIKVFNVETGKLIVSHDAYERRTTALAMLPEFGWLISGTNERDIRLWDLDRMEGVGDLRGHLDRVNDFVVTPDQQTVFSCSDDYTVRRWGTRTAGEILLERAAWERVAESFLDLSSLELRIIEKDPERAPLERRVAKQLRYRNVLAESFSELNTES